MDLQKRVGTALYDHCREAWTGYITQDGDLDFDDYQAVVGAIERLTDELAEWLVDDEVVRMFIVQARIEIQELAEDHRQWIRSQKSIEGQLNEVGMSTRDFV